MFPFKPFMIRIQVHTVYNGNEIFEMNTCEHSSTFLFFHIIFLIKFITDWQRKSNVLINLTDGDTYSTWYTVPSSVSNKCFVFPRTIIWNIFSQKWSSVAFKVNHTVHFVQFDRIKVFKNIHSHLSNHLWKFCCTLVYIQCSVDI